MLRLLRKEPYLLGFAAITAAFSTPGQTVLVSLFVPHIQDSFALDPSQFGLVYGAATFVAAMALPRIGSLLDSTALPRFSLLVALGLAAACLCLSAAPQVAVLFAGFLALRLLGQGTMSLTSSTTVARYLDQHRGKALGLAGLGFPIGEALFPIPVAFVLAHYGWRGGYICLALLIVLVFVPVSQWCLRRSDLSPAAPLETEPSENPQPQMTRGDMLKDKRFWITLLPILTPPFVITVLFVHAGSVFQMRGWENTALMASAVTGYALARGVSSVAIGPVIDQLTGTKVFALSGIPMAIGFWILAQGGGPMAYALCVGSAGLTVGLGVNGATAMWAEMYGTLHLGSIKGLISSLAVMSTAVGPAAMGWVLTEYGPSTFATMLAGLCTASVAVATVLLFVARRA